MNSHYRMLSTTAFEAASGCGRHVARKPAAISDNDKEKQSFERKEYVSKWQCVDKVANYSVAFYSYFFFFLF